MCTNVAVNVPIKRKQKTPGALKDLAPVVRRVDNAIHWTNLYPLNSAVRFINKNPLDSDLSLG